MTKDILFLALDLGSTHFKAGLFDAHFAMLRSRSVDVTLQQQSGGTVIDPSWASRTLYGLIRDVFEGHNPSTITAIGIASMAETGLLVDREGLPATPMLPWFNRSAEHAAERISAAGESFLWSGIYPGYKAPLARLLWLRDDQGVSLLGRTWLSAADYAAFLLTGSRATDDSLAGRTLAFDIHRRDWNADWLEVFGISSGLFPESGQAGRVIGRLSAQAATQCGLAAGIPVTIAGHDHICAALAAGVIEPGPALDSMGTAEALLGALDGRPLTEADHGSGLLYGCHVLPGKMYWLGSLSTSGGSVEWLRTLFGDIPPSYEALEHLLGSLPDGPGEIIFLPYLNGSGAPHSDPLARGAWVGLRSNHTRADLYKAVLEGTAYEMELIRRSALAVPGVRADRLIAIGGGARSRSWLAIKADVSGQPVYSPAMPEATLSGAALLASVAAGVFPTAASAAQSARMQLEQVQPDANRHAAYNEMFEKGFLALQSAVRDFSHFRRSRH